jgi:uncharacterized protein YraI
MLSSSFRRQKIFIYLIADFFLVSLIFPAYASVRAQTIVLCAVPSTSISGAYVTVNADQAQVNVRSGPNSYQYGKIGVLFTYESAPALGRSIGGDWIQISCPGAPGGAGWVYFANVTLTTQIELSIIEIPATSTPLLTSTVDPALAAEFPVVQPTVTRLPTFTPVIPQTPPTFTDVPTSLLNRNLQGGLIIGIVFVGMLIFLISFLLKR